MSCRQRLPLLAALLAVALCHAAFAPLAANAAARRPARQKEEKKEEKKKEEKGGQAADKPKLSKQERKYQEIKRFSVELFGKDQEFKNEVEDAYRRKQREHAEYAFDINTRNSLDDQISRDGDKLKIYDALYDNPLAQDYVNRLGQSLVPAGSTKLYAFKITLNPIPEAKSLSTGTVYISTGLLSQIDNEAQLAYILGHEVGHIEKEHWFEDVLVGQGIEPYNEKQAKRRAMWGALIGAAAAGVGGLAGGSDAALNSAVIAVSLAPSLLKFVIPNAVSSWDRIQEDEADQLGLKYMLNRNYDPREVPKFYASMQRTTRRDPRVGLGFMGDAERIVERLVAVNAFLNGNPLGSAMVVGSFDLAERRGAPRTSDNPTKALNASANAEQRGEAAQKALNTQYGAELKAKLDSGELIGSSAEFEAVMAALKRDNGIRALYFDMFQMARDNLEDSLLIRSNDPHTHFYYGKVLKLTARSAAEKQRALSEFVRAIELDKRRTLPEARLHRAMALIENKESSQVQEIVSTLKEYVSLYQRQNGGQLPPNMDVIYDYMQEAGEVVWSAPPVMNISTKNIDPVAVSGAAAQPRPTEAPVNATPPKLPPAGAGRKP
jgi:Zn-dependent protease with chaperone function